MTNNTINNYLDLKGIKHSNLGYKFLMEALTQIATKKNPTWKITELYSEIAEKYNTNGANVERAIRHSIINSKLTNKEFIAKAIDDIVFNVENIYSMQNDKIS